MLGHVKWGRMGLGVLVAAGGAMVGLTGATPVAKAGVAAPPLQAGKTTMRYIVEAHPDDAVTTWELVDAEPDEYTVFILTTQGERGNACLTAEEAATYPYEEESGPEKYEGKDNPPERDLGERHPYGNPWQGMDTKACKDARVASWHWFLDDLATPESGLPNFGFSAGADPWRSRSHRKYCPVELGPCVDVWTDAKGARIAFDLGDYGWDGDGSGTQYLDPEPHTVDDVIASIESLRANRAWWQLPVLPEAGIFAAASGCAALSHHDHDAVQDAIYDHDFDAGPQTGAVCAQDPRFAESPHNVIGPDPLVWWSLNEVELDTERRLGPAGVNYGWLAPGDTETGRLGPQPTWYSWRRFAD